MAYTKYQLNQIEELLKDADLGGSFVNRLLFPLKPVKQQTGSIVYEKRERELLTLAQMRVDDESTLITDRVKLQKGLGWFCDRYGKGEKLTYAELVGGEIPSIGQMKQALVEILDDVELGFENNAKTEFDTYCKHSDGTQCKVASAKWTPATYSAMLIDMNAAWEAMFLQCGRYPNIIFAPQPVTEVISQAFGLLDEPKRMADILRLGINETMYKNMRSATLVTVDSSYYSKTSSTYVQLWNKHLYMAYSRAMPRADTKARTFGQTFVWQPEGKEFFTHQSEPDSVGDRVVSALTYKDPLVISSTNAYKISGPDDGGNFDLV